MKFLVTHSPIEAEVLRAELENDSCGALATFEGWVRDHNDGRQVLRLEYEVYRPLASAKGLEILREAAERYEIADALCVHREGMLELGDIAVAVLVAAAHRDAAFKACRYIIDEVKQRVPIWKKEHYADGDAHWVNCVNTGASGFRTPPGPG